jgi:hypothetical protein
MTTKSEVQENRRQLIETIRETDLELIELKASKKELDKDISEHVAGYQESKDLKDLAQQIETKKAQLNAKLSQDPDFSVMMDQKAGINQQIADAKEILSTHVVAWKTLTGEDQVEYDEVMGKEVIVTGRLGKLERYQTNMFTPPETRAKLAGPVQRMQDLADKHGAEITIGDGKSEVKITPKRGRGRPKKNA